MKKIVLLTASPRAKGNSSAMAAAFAEEIGQNGAELVRFDTAFSGVKGCIACDRCFENGRACCFDDGFNDIMDAILSADAIAFASPVYWYTFPAGFKAVMDKFYSLCRAGKDLAGKKCVLMSCCEDDDMKAFEGVLFSYKESMGLLRCEDVGQELVKDVHRPGAVLETDAPQRCRQLARELLAAIE